MDSDDWEVAGSDAEDDEYYTPKPERIIELFGDLSKGKVPQLEVEIVPRRPPSVELPSSLKLPQPAIPEVPEATEFAPVDEPNEFDFDSQAVDNVKRFTPKRAPNKAQVKKVARMDKVCSNIIKYQKMDAEQLEKSDQKS